MTAPHLARLAAERLLAERRLEVPPPSADIRARGIEAVQRAMEAKVKAKTRRAARLVTFAAAAALALTAGGAAWYTHRAQGGPVKVLATHVTRTFGREVAITAKGAAPQDGGEGATLYAWGGALEGQPLAPNSSLRPGSRVVAKPRGHAILGFSTGTELTVEDGGDLTVLEASALQHFELRGGTLRANVAHLLPGQRFVITTPDGEVEVRGTSFRVDVLRPEEACDDGLRTHVQVFDGAVVVRARGGEARITPGNHFPAMCSAGTSVRSLPRAATAPVVNNASTLSRQNDLFADAMTAKRRGDLHGALAALDELLEKYPSSPLRESAEAERLRVLRDVDPVRAQGAARAYLRQFPHGFARAEAQSLVDTP